MTIQAETFETAKPTVLTAVVRIVVLRVKAVIQGFKNRRDAALLAGLDDRMLADIGLTRGDLRDAFSEPLWRDPTNVLVTRVGERRRHRGNSVFALPPQLVDGPSLVPHATRAQASCSA